jgi:2-oxoglutarate ferredoxin oxidoreductase subunit beta
MTDSGNSIGLTKSDYRGAPTTLCAGCGHNSIANQVIAAAYELELVPEKVIKFSGIGCSSKSPTYFLGRSFGFNSLHGRMPSLATGALFGDHSLLGIGVSGDGDTANIGMGQFKHIIRRNPPLVYIIENNGVYGLTKGQFSATAEPGLELKAQGVNKYMPIDIVVEALASRATFVARSFAGDATQVKELIKAAMSHNGIAILDIISPCVTFNNRDDSQHSYTWNREHREMIHDLNYVPVKEEIVIEEEFPEGVTHIVTLHDGSHIVLRKLDQHYDPTDRVEALRAVQQATRENVLLTGLIYIDTERPSLFEMFNLPKDKPLNRFKQDEIRPSRQSLKMINEMMF